MHGLMVTQSAAPPPGQNIFLCPCYMPQASLEVGQLAPLYTIGQSGCNTTASKGYVQRYRLAGTNASMGYANTHLLGMSSEMCMQFYYFWTKIELTSVGYIRMSLSVDRALFLCSPRIRAIRILPIFLPILLFGNASNSSLFCS